jgi:hypothetical protein
LDWRYPSDNGSSIAYHEDEIPIMVPVSVRLTGIPRVSLKWLVFTFHMLSGVWQLLVVTVAPVQNFYEKELSKRRNSLRWFEYSVTAPLMIICIAVLMGQSDVGVLFLLYWLTFTLMMLGLLTECMDNNVFIHIIGWIVHIAAWCCVSFTFFYSFEHGTRKPPVRFRPILYIIYFSMMTLFGCFGVVQLVSVALPKTSFYSIEVTYSILSLVSKIVLGLLVWQAIKLRDDIGIRMI